MNYVLVRKLSKIAFFQHLQATKNLQNDKEL